MAGIYVHIPFCESFCTYCGFYSEVCPRGVQHGRYVAALAWEMALRRGFFAPGEAIKTLYFGGGTPSLLSAEDFLAITDALRQTFDLSGLEEFTVEVNPEDVARGTAPLEAYAAAGVNRISMGVQSFCDAHLKWMNRRHTAASALEAFARLRSCGFGNISIDLIFGFAGLADEQWRYNLEQAVALRPEHISAYQMSVDPESTLAEMTTRGEYSEPDDDTCARQYALLQDTLEAAGYLQYEISNFCLPGHHSRHNSAYWDRSAYLGLGAAAHSFNGIDRRQWNPASAEEYCSALEAGHLPYGGGERLTADDVYNERIMLGLRTARGVPKDIIKQPGILQDTGDAWRIPRDKFFICDRIIEDYLK